MNNNRTVDFAQLIRSSECGGLTLDFQSQLVDQLKEEFTDEEQTWFVANFYVYLQYHPTNDYPIKLENVWNMIGFATKANAKRTLKNNFVENEDYIVFIPRDENPQTLLIPTDEQLFETKKEKFQELSSENTVIRRDDGKFAEETILLNVDTFKNLCMITKTEKSKKIRKYYVKLEQIFSSIINQQRLEFKERMSILETDMKKKEQDFNFYIKEKDKEIARVKKLNASIQNRRYADHPLAQVVYVYQDGNEIKIGQTNDLSNREKSYLALNKTGKFIFKSDVLNSKLSERVCHHLLDKFRINSKEEWFKLDNKLAIDTVKVVSLFMDTFIDNPAHFIATILPILQKLSEENDIDATDTSEIARTGSRSSPRQGTSTEGDGSLRSTSEITRTGSDTVTFSKGTFTDVVDRRQGTVTDVMDATNSVEIETVTNTNCRNFDNFLNEKVIIEENGFCLREDLRLAYRIWAKNVDKKTHTDFYEYMSRKFKSGVEHYGEMRRNVFRGLTLRPLVFIETKEEQWKNVEEFILEKCEVGYNNRISYNDFFNEYITWMKTQDANFTLSYKTRQSIQKYLETQFSGGRVHLSSATKTTHLFGVWGLSLKGFNGIKERKLTRKLVQEIDPETRVVLRTWSSLCIASDELNIPRSTLSNNIRFERLCSNNKIYRYHID
jgi:phage anti-repressor protein